MTRFFRFSSQDGTDFLKKSYEKLCAEKLKQREHEEQDLTPRNEYHGDFTRVLYSPAFRRLQGKMQILGIRNDAFFRNRLTHSLEVSQIARNIATNIGTNIGGDAYTCQNDLYVIEAAALAHDIGHPAFGHSGERVLDKICQQDGTGRFEGNAQNFRVLRTLEKKLPDKKGLNLTFRTLLAINKYLVCESVDKSVKKVMYKDDYDLLTKIREQTNLAGERTLDVQIIDVADEIAYAVHDLEDALTFGYFNIDELLYLLEKKISKENFKAFNDAVLNAKEKAKKASSYRTTQEYSQIFRRSLVSQLTNQFINDIGVVEVSEEAKKEHGTPNISQELGFCELGDLVHGLKKVIFKAICRHDHINVYEQRGTAIIEGLYRIYTNLDNLQLLTPDYRPQLPKDIKFYSNLNYPQRTQLNRAAIDFIAGMMDDFAKGTYERYYGVNFDSIPIVGRNFSL